MKVFRDLEIHSNREGVDEFATGLRDSENTYWRRDEEAERTNNLASEKPYCFVRTGDEVLPSARLWLFEKGAQTWWVSNIVPTEVQQLTIDQYNAILLDFHRLLDEANPKFSVVVSEEDTTVAGIAGSEVDKLLRAFSNNANKSTGSAHPLDRQRWFNFIIAASQYPDLTTKLIVTSLMELGWSEEFAHDLGAEYSLGIELLQHQRK